MDEAKTGVHNHYAAVVQDYTDEYSAAYPGYPANQKRLDIVLQRVQGLGARTLLDCGCGEGTPLHRICEAGVAAWGFDLVPAMVERARTHLEAAGLPHRVWTGDITRAADFQPSGIDTPPAYDVCIAMGVFPHLADEVAALKNMAAVTRPGGRVLVEFRNELFGLFTLNRYSYEFFRDELIRAPELASRHPESRAELAELEAKLKDFFRIDLPPRRRGTAGAPGYDEILSKLHNPYGLNQPFAEAGLSVTGLHFYHYHAMPPMFEREYPELFRRLSLAMEENPADWRGHFMASAFVAEAVKDGD